MLRFICLGDGCLEVMFFEATARPGCLTQGGVWGQFGSEKAFGEAGRCISHARISHAAAGHGMSGSAV